MKQTFTERNAQRKAALISAATGNRRGSITEARKRRRIYKGAFGLSPSHIFNDLALGTTARLRSAKDDA